MVSPPDVSEALIALSKDLRKKPPCSPRKSLAGYVIAARILDKCRAELNGSAGEYCCLENSRLDRYFLDATGIIPEEFRELVATGASDIEVTEWIKAHSKMTNPEDVAKWNNQLRSLPLNKLPIEIQQHFETFISKQIPPLKPVLCLFDKFDLEDGNI
jgi:hypothetical protein